MMTVSRRLPLIVMGLALAGVSSAAAAADAESSVPAPSAFVKMAAQAGMTEVEAGKVALSKSKDPRDPQFRAAHGQLIMAVPTSSSRAWPRPRASTPPRKLDAEHQAVIDALRSKSGADFDSAYSQHMNMDHDKAIALFEGASKSTDPEFAGFARKTLPKLQEHKQLASQLACALMWALSDKDGVYAAVLSAAARGRPGTR
jgi:putative membrane protein